MPSTCESVSITDLLTASGMPLRFEQRPEADPPEIHILTDDPRRCLLHWGLRSFASPVWHVPPEGARPAASRLCDGPALQTPLSAGDPVRISVPPDAPDVRLVEFVLYFPDEQRWDNNRGRNYCVAFAGSEPADLQDDLARDIIAAETGRHSWTLMHRYNLCYDLLDRAAASSGGLALVFAWLRFSFVRQLDWQRRYNTQPRELAHALDRLSARFAGVYSRGTVPGMLVRLCLATLGRGSGGQRVRDEILAIMHRHHIKEIAGHFLEQWHQKLHNNTTPDDVVLCEAYCAFLESGGSRDVFYARLHKGGVSRKRLASYERPITSEPEFFAQIKDPLLHDFRHFLGIIRAVHSGTDLESAGAAARGLLDQDRARELDLLLQNRHHRTLPFADLAGAVLNIRTHLHALLAGSPDAGQKRDALFLDLALEEYLRTAAETAISRNLSADNLAEMLTPILQNLRLAMVDDELPFCDAHWQWLAARPRQEAAWALQAYAALERLGRVAGAWTERLQKLVQPAAERLGRACGVQPWFITLFSEEVCRGQLLFVAAMLIQQLTVALRRQADLGAWQVVSHGQGCGRVEVVSGLHALEGRRDDAPVIVVANAVAGDEDIPARVTALITPDSTDLLSHVAIRARNAGVLFATCYSEETLTLLKALNGRQVRLHVTSAGDVVITEGTAAPGAARAEAVPPRLMESEPCAALVIGEADFSSVRVGAKSCNLVHLKAGLPERIGVPDSIAVPFDVFETVLNDERNHAAAAHYRDLARRLAAADERSLPELLGALRTAVMKLRAPEALLVELRVMAAAAGLSVCGDRRAVWQCITRVWASLWNERAQASRMAFGISHERLCMAVLIQQVIEADYSFVVHTTNPLNGDSRELYAEVVPGLGETLVGNHPGRALGFTCVHGGNEPAVVSYPGKSRGLFGGGLIFRSDSNAEDLTGYAGAGLYDSVMLPQPEARLLDYTADPLWTDEAFRKKLLTLVAEAGTEVARATDSAQDIEGCVRGGRVYVVQTRHQAGAPPGSRLLRNRRTLPDS